MGPNLDGRWDVSLWLMGIYLENDLPTLYN